MAHTTLVCGDSHPGVAYPTPANDAPNPNMPHSTPSYDTHPSLSRPPPHPNKPRFTPSHGPHPTLIWQVRRVGNARPRCRERLVPHASRLLPRAPRAHHLSLIHI
eukprot:2009229-Prymnesium_polylepis.1